MIGLKQSSADLLSDVVGVQRKLLLRENSQAGWDASLQLFLDATDSPIGFIGEWICDGLAATSFRPRSCNRNLDQSTPANEKANGDVDATLSGFGVLVSEVVRHARPVMSSDPVNDLHANGGASRSSGIDCCLGLPIFGDAGQLVAVVGIANRATGYDPSMSADLQPLCDALGIAITAQLRERQHQATEASLRASESRYRTFVDNASDAFFIQDTDGRVVDVNRQACVSLGCTRDELVGMVPSDFDPKYDPTQVAAVLQRLNQGETLTFESQHRRRDGTVFPVELRLAPFWVNGQRQHVAIVRDISKRRQFERKLRDAQEQLALLLEGANIGLWDLDLETQSMVFSKEWKSQLGFREDEIEIPVEHWRTRLHPDDLAIAMTKAQQTTDRCSGDYHAEFRARHKDGSWRWILSRGCALPGRHGKATRMLGVHIDITERKLAEERAREDEARLRTLLENLECIAVQGYEPDGTITFWNKASETLFGYTAEQAIGRDIVELLLAQDSWAEERRIMAEALASQNPLAAQEVRVRRRDGAQMTVLASRVVHRPPGRPPEFFCLDFDITARKVVEDRLRRSEELLAEELDVIKKLHDISSRQVGHDDLQPMFQEIVATAVSVMNADRGNLLLLDPNTNLLRLAGHVGFEESFLTYCRQIPVDEPGAACARSVKLGHRIIVPDVRVSEIFANQHSQDLLGNARVSALVATPLISRSGRPFGTITVHFAEPTTPDEKSLRRIDLLARQAADLVERAQSEVELREREEQLRALVEVSSEIIWTADARGVVRQDSPEWRDFTGQSFDEWMGFGWLNALHPDDYERGKQTWRASVETLAPFNCEYRLWHAKSRQWRWMHDRGVCLRNTDGSPRMWVGISCDIHDRKAAADANAKLAAIVDSSDDVIYSLSPEGMITSWNAAAERLYGYPVDEILGKSALILVPPDRHQDVQNYLSQVRNGQGVQRLESVWLRRDSSQGFVSLTISPIRDCGGRVIGASVIARDVSAQRALEAERERLHREVLDNREQLKRLTRRAIEAQESERRHLALELHDEIGQVLTTVNLCLEGLRSRIDPAYIDRLDDSVRVVNQAIEQVRDLSLDLRPASLDILGLESALRGYAQRQCARAGLIVEVESEINSVRLSPVLETVCFRVAQEALTNVLRHANATRCRIDLSFCRDEFHILVADDGIGFDVAEVRDRSSRGEGFGLLGMRERVQLFGGHIEVESTPGCGTVIRARFPLAQAPDSEFTS